ncbi:MAG: hypothetical protein ACOCUV_03785 [bacterium]
MAIKKEYIYNLPLTIILVQDPDDKGYTVFSKQFPNIIAEGDDEDTAIRNLFETMHVAFKDQADEDKELIARKYNVSKKEINLTALEPA